VATLGSEAVKQEQGRAKTFREKKAENI